MVQTLTCNKIIIVKNYTLLAYYTSNPIRKNNLSVSPDKNKIKGNKKD